MAVAAVALCRAARDMFHWCFGVTRGDYLKAIHSLTRQVSLRGVAWVPTLSDLLKKCLSTLLCSILETQRSLKRWLDLPEHMSS